MVFVTFFDGGNVATCLLQNADVHHVDSDVPVLPLGRQTSRYAQNPLDTFPRNREVANLLATSRCNGIWETTRHNGLLPANFNNLLQTCCGLATGKLV